jgi:hypothetical protein
MLAELAVIDTVNRFHLCVDRRDWPAARSCLADTVQVSLDGGQVDRELPAEEFLGMIRSSAEQFSATQHLVSGHHVRLDADATARCQASYQNHHITDGNRWTLAGLQDLRLRQQGTGWHITTVVLHQAWEEGSRPMPAK